MKNKIREYRKKIKYLTIQEAARELNISIASLSRKERNLQVITPRDAILFCKWSGGWLRWNVEELVPDEKVSSGDPIEERIPS